MTYGRRLLMALLAALLLSIVIFGCSKKSDSSNPVAPPPVGIARFVGAWTLSAQSESLPGIAAWQSELTHGGTLTFQSNGDWTYTKSDSTGSIYAAGTAMLTGDTLLVTYDTTSPAAVHRTPEPMLVVYNSDILEITTVYPDSIYNRIEYSMYAKPVTNMNVAVGIVLDTLNNPVSGASVTLIHNSLVYRTAVTGAKGIFGLDSLEAGSYHGQAGLVGTAPIDSFSVTTGNIVLLPLTLH